MSSGALGGHVGLWARSELRRRWLSLVLLGVLGGLAAGLTIAAYDGAQRSYTAYTRMRQQTHGADAVVFPSQIAVYDFDFEALDTIPGVAAWGGFSLGGGSIDGLPPYATPFITSGDDWFSSIEGGKVLEGRLPAPGRPDEAVLTTPAVKQLPQLGVGSKLVWRTLSPEQGEQYGDGVPEDFDWQTDADGPVTELTIVGIVRLPMESVAAFASDGMLLTSPAWFEAHPTDASIWFTNAVVRLEHGAADLPALHAGVERIAGRSDIPIKDLSTDVKRVQRSLDVERTALLMFAAAIAITALVLVGQAIVRATTSGAVSVYALRAMGATSGALVLGLALPMVVTLVALISTTAVVSVVASQWFPVGLARQVDPITGIHVSVATELLGLGVTIVLAAALVLATAIMLQRRIGSRKSRRAHLMSAATRAGVPVSPAIGASLAVDAPAERGGRSRLALIAAVIGVVAVVGALTLVRGIDDIVAHPERTGATWDMVITGTGGMPDEQAIALVLGNEHITDMALTGRVPTNVGGADVPVYGLDVLKGEMAFTVVRGDPPRADDEIAVGPATQRLLGIDIGDTVSVGASGTPMSVVGVALLSQQPHSSFDEGGWVTRAAYDALAAEQFGEAESYEEAFVSVADGLIPEQVAGELPPNWEIAPPAQSSDALNLVQVRDLPIYLAAFLAFLAVGAVAHALFTSARQRERELAVLRALGLTGRQVAACVSWQALVTGLVAAIIGLPIGVVVGQRVWRGITEQLSFVYVGPVASTLLVVAAPACLVACGVLAIVPARNIARRRITETLRQE